MSHESQPIKAVVQNIISVGNHGPFAIATVDSMEGSITFSLLGDVWLENTWPEPGEFVVLWNLRQKRSGWRATKARFFSLNDEQIANSKEQIVNKTRALVNRWRAKLFPSDDDHIWAYWVNDSKRGWRDLQALVLDPEIDDRFKARALYVLLMPDLTWCPFYWVHQGDGQHHPRAVSFDLGLLSPDLLAWVSEIVTEFYQHLKANPHRADGHWIGAMEAYNDMVHFLLRVLPEDQAEHLFGLFELNDVNPWSDMDFASGYNPLSQLFNDPAVPEQWKRKADYKMRQIIQNEIWGDGQPRQKHEFALQRYAQIIEPDISGNIPYSSELWREQIGFVVVAASDINYWDIIRWWPVSCIARTLAETGDNLLLRAFARLVLNVGHFRIYDQNDLKAAELMLSALGSTDKERMQRYIDNGKLLLANSDIASQVQADRASRILEQMKKHNS